MNKPSNHNQASVFCGIDVSAKTLAVAVIVEEGQPIQQREFPNRLSGWKGLIQWLAKHKSRTRVSLEATGVYSLDLALALAAAPQVELAVLNPKLVNRFAQTLTRSRSDAAAAVVLAHYSQRMPFTPWQPPRRCGLELRTVARHIGSLVAQQTREKNQLHALEGSQTVPRAVLEDIRRSLASVARRVEKMRGTEGKSSVPMVNSTSVSIC